MLVPSRKTSTNPETLACRILMIMWSLGTLLRTIKPVEEALNLFKPMGENFKFSWFPYLPAPPNYPLRRPKYHLIDTIRPLIEVRWTE